MKMDANVSEGASGSDVQDPKRRVERRPSPWRVRWAHGEAEIVTRAATAAGVTRNAFIRAACIKAARETLDAA